MNWSILWFHSTWPFITYHSNPKNARILLVNLEKFHSSMSPALYAVPTLFHLAFCPSCLPFYLLQVGKSTGGNHSTKQFPWQLDHTSNLSIGMFLLYACYILTSPSTILAWPKSSFEFFWKISGETWTFWPTQCYNFKKKSLQLSSRSSSRTWVMSNVPLASPALVQVVHNRG